MLVTLLALSLAGYVTDNGGQSASPGSTTARPALVYSELAEGRSDQWRPRIVLTCSGVTTSVQVRGIRPRQAWPQPAVQMRLGDT